MEIIKNSRLQERRHFLLRAIAHNNVTKEECQDEMDKIDEQIEINLKEALSQCKENIKEEISNLKETKKYDGDFKRGVANYLIDILTDNLTHDEVKGVFRQGYKIMRTK